MQRSARAAHTHLIPRSRSYEWFSLQQMYSTLATHLFITKCTSHSSHHTPARYAVAFFFRSLSSLFTASISLLFNAAWHFLLTLIRLLYEPQFHTRNRPPPGILDWLANFHEIFVKFSFFEIFRHPNRSILPFKLYCYIQNAFYFSLTESGN